MSKAENTELTSLLFSQVNKSKGCKIEFNVKQEKEPKRGPQPLIDWLLLMSCQLI